MPTNSNSTSSSQQQTDGAPGTAAATAAANGSSMPAANGSSAGGTEAAAAAAAAKAAAASKSRCTVKLTERFYARAGDIYECFVVQGRLQAFTRSPAVVEPQPGGNFSWFNDHVTVSAGGFGAAFVLCAGQHYCKQVVL